MILHRHARPCAGHPRLQQARGFKVVDGRDKPGHDDIGLLNQSEKQLNRNRSFRGTSQATEKSSLFAHGQMLKFRAKPLNQNRKVKP